jgi:CRP/FNR family transcriptional regulator
MPFDATPTAVNTDCLLCPVRNCLGRSVGTEPAAAWGEMLSPRMAVMPGAGALYHRGDRVRSIYSVRGGCLKTFTVDADGNERIRGFYLPGDLVGLDGLGGGVCLSTAAAVVPSQVCVAPLAELRQLMLRQPEVAQRMVEQTSRELALALAVSGDYSAEQRVAAFLLHLRQRTGGGEVLRLPMAQRDVGNYLRLATETVCRTLKGMERKGWLVLGERSIRFVKENQLSAAAEAVGLSQGSSGLPKAA